MKLGYKRNENGMLDLLIVPESGLETEMVFDILHSDNYPLEVKGKIILTDDCVPPQIILFGNNIVAKADPRFKKELQDENQS